MSYNEYMKKLKKNEAHIDKEDIKDVYEQVKLYNNGEHEIAIPHSTRRVKKRPKKKEQEFVVRIIDGKVVARSKPKLEEIDSDEDEYINCPFEEDIENYWKNKLIKGEKAVINADMVSSNDENTVKTTNKPKSHSVTRGSEFARLYIEKNHIVCQYIKKIFEE